MRSLIYPRPEFWAGVRAMIPLIVGAIPFGIIFGTLAITNGLSVGANNGLSVGATLVMSAFVFAGSSQFIAAGLVAVKTGWLLIVLTTFVVNLRHLLYAVSLLLTIVLGMATFFGWQGLLAILS